MTSANSLLTAGTNVTPGRSGKYTGLYGGANLFLSGLFPVFVSMKRGWSHILPFIFVAELRLLDVMGFLVRLVVGKVGW